MAKMKKQKKNNQGYEGLTLREEMAYLLGQYDKEVVLMICNKYGLDFQVALRRFIFSEAYRMLANPDLAMWEFCPHGIFDMWESEQITGDPRNSIYIRGE